MLLLFFHQTSVISKIPIDWRQEHFTRFVTFRSLSGLCWKKLTATLARAQTQEGGQEDKVFCKRYIVNGNVDGDGDDRAEKSAQKITKFIFLKVRKLKNPDKTVYIFVILFIDYWGIVNGKNFRDSF